MATAARRRWRRSTTRTAGSRRRRPTRGSARRDRRSVRSCFRAHAASDGRRQEPWSFGPDAEEAVRDLVQLRYELMPYLTSLFDEASRTGAPVLRPLVFEFQEDEASLAVADEVMLGPFVLA